MPDQEVQQPQSSSSDADTTPLPAEKSGSPIIHWDKIGPAFWTVAGLISLLVNIILVVLLIVMGQQLFALKSVVQKQLLGGLYNNFVSMDQAHIRTSIPVNTEVQAKFDLPVNAEVPAKFDLPLNTTTDVVLTQDVHLTNATIYEFNAGGALYIPRAHTNIILPAGTKMPVALNLTVPVDQKIPINLIVPVDQKIPVNLMVNVDIPLNQTELHPPFAGLQEVVKPYYTYLGTLPDSWQEALCGTNPTGICRQLVH